MIIAWEVASSSLGSVRHSSVDGFEPQSQAVDDAAASAGGSQMNWPQYEDLQEQVRSLSITTDRRSEPLELNPHYRDLRWGHEARTVFGPDRKPGDGVPGLSYVYSDRLVQWDGKKADRAWHAALESGATPQSADLIQAYLSAYYDRPVIVEHILSGVNISNGYPYWVAGYREAATKPRGKRAKVEAAK